MTDDGFGSTEQGWLIKGGGSGLVCRVPSAATFTLTNLNWVTPRWQTLDTKLRPQGFFPAIFYPHTLTALTAASRQWKWLWKLKRSVMIRSSVRVCFGRRSMTSLLRGNFWNKQVTQTGSSGYQLHSGEQRARSGTDHTTWLQTPEYIRVYVRERVFRRLGRNLYFFLKLRKTKGVRRANKSAAEFQRVPENFPWVYRTTQLSETFKSSVFAIRNGWFSRSNTKRLASVTMWKASGQSQFLSHSETLTHWLALSKCSPCPSSSTSGLIFFF